MIPIPVLLILAALLVASASTDGSLQKFVNEIAMNYNTGYLK